MMDGDFDDDGVDDDDDDDHDDDGVDDGVDDVHDDDDDDHDERWVCHWVFIVSWRYAGWFPLALCFHCIDQDLVRGLNFFENTLQKGITMVNSKYINKWIHKSINK